LRQHGVVGALLGQAHQQVLVAVAVAPVAQLLLVETLVGSLLAHAHEQAAGFAGEGGGQLMVVHATGATGVANKRLAVRRSVPASTGFTSTASASARFEMNRSASR